MINNSQKNIQTAYVLTTNDPTIIQKTSAQCAKELSAVIKTCLGPKAMQKIVITKANSIILTNDGNSILRELDVSHPSSRCLIDLSQTQDDECGDGTTTVAVLGAEMLSRLVPLLSDIHPNEMTKLLTEMKEIALKTIDKISSPILDSKIYSIVAGAVATKVCSALKLDFTKMALDAVKCVKEDENNRIDLRKNLKVIKVLGDLNETRLIDGVVINKEIWHHSMPRTIENAKVLILDISIEYKKGESAVNMDFENSEDVTNLLRIEEAQVVDLVDTIIKSGANLVVTSKGMCDLAIGLFANAKITALRRFRDSDVVKIAKATGAAIVSRREDIKEEKLGDAGLFEYKTIGNDNHCFIYKCKNPKAVTLQISSPSADLCNELERNFMDAVKVAKNIYLNPKMIPGGGAAEFSIINALREQKFVNCNKSQDVVDMVCRALESIPVTLSSNAGVTNPLGIIHKCLIEHGKGNYYIGVNGNTGEICDVRAVINDPVIVKTQCLKSAFDFTIQFMRVDSIIECKTGQ